MSAEPLIPGIAQDKVWTDRLTLAYLHAGNGEVACHARAWQLLFIALFSGFYVAVGRDRSL